MNRAQRRRTGWTERRVRKQAYRQGMIPHTLVNAGPEAGLSLTALASMDFEAWKLRLKEQNTDRLQGKPRRWQVERARRRTMNKENKTT